MPYMPSTKMVLLSLRARSSFGKKAGKPTKEYFEKVLKINNLDCTLDQLRNLGFSVVIGYDDVISLEI